VDGRNVIGCMKIEGYKTEKGTKKTLQIKRALQVLQIQLTLQARYILNTLSVSF
jgi:hypothetical protein